MSDDRPSRTERTVAEVEPRILGHHSVLLIDDDENLLSSLRRALRKEPYEVRTAPSPQAAEQILARTRIDLIVCDEHMPGLSGTQYFSQLRSRRPEIVRILLTGGATVEVAMRAINRGEVHRLFVKPCDPGDLAAAIRGALKQKDLMAGAKELLATVRQQRAVLEELEKHEPGISHVERDESGAVLVLDDPVDLDALLRDVAEELTPARPIHVRRESREPMPSTPGRDREH